MTRPSLTLELVPSKPAPAQPRNGNWDCPALSAPPPSYSSPLPSSLGSRPPSIDTIPPRPSPFVFSSSTLLKFPSRLSRPPRINPIGSQWTFLPEMSVRLEDLLDMRHISPLSLKDFEQYLLFEEYCAENLYFILWLNDYTSRYSSTEATTLQLNHSIARAEATFFSSDSQYELNLAAGRVSQFYDLIGRTEENTKGVASSNQLRVPAHPDAFAAIRDDVDDMLRASARRFVRARSRNAGQQRAICVVFGGLFTIAIALAPLMLSHFTDRGRWIRFGIIPPLWLGLTVFLCSVNGICIILYMLGGSRQLYPFELVRPPISAPIYQQPAYAASFSSVKVSGDVKSPQQSAKPSLRSMSSITQLSGVVVHGPYKHDGKTPANLESGTLEEYALPQIPAITPLTQEFGFETAGFIPSRDSCEELTIGGHSTYPDSSVGASSTRYEVNLESGHHRGPSSTAKLAFDFDTLPIKKLDSNSGPPALEATYGGGAKGYFVKVFAPMTEVRSPVISRAQWEVVIRSGALAGFLTFIITAVLVAVPM